MIFRSAEVRWFFPTPLPAASAKFADNKWSFLERRVDFYFPLPGIEAVGIKLRGERFEIKARRAAAETMKLTGKAAGSVELWDKWSLDAPIVQTLREAMLADVEMIAIEKRRWLMKYALDDDAPKIVVGDATSLEGCNVEVTGLRWAEQLWWSLGFEVFSRGDRHRSNLLRAVEQFLRRYAPPAALATSASFSYPVWLARLGAFPTSGFAAGDHQRGETDYSFRHSVNDAPA